MNFLRRIYNSAKQTVLAVSRKIYRVTKKTILTVRKKCTQLRDDIIEYCRKRSEYFNSLCLWYEGLTPNQQTTVLVTVFVISLIPTILTCVYGGPAAIALSIILKFASLGLFF